MFPVLPQQHQHGHANAGERQVEAAAQQRGGEFGRRGNAHQDHGGDGQHDVDALPQQHLGVGVFQLNRLLLLLLQLQFRHTSLARLQDLLHAQTHAARLRSGTYWRAMGRKGKTASERDRSWVLHLRWMGDAGRRLGGSGLHEKISPEILFYVLLT